MLRFSQYLTKITIVGGVALLAACSAADQMAAPKVNRVKLPAGAPSLDVIINSVAPDSLSADFTVTPTGGTFVLGNHAVYFPANSICDPATSSYGPDHWDEPCEPLTAPISFHADVRADSTGRTWVDFTPAVRFVPTTDPNQTVWMMMKPAGVQLTADNYQSFGMEWMPNGTPDTMVNEVATDSTLKTYADVAHNIIFRRIKHFSGYVVASGFVDLGTVDVDVTASF